MGPEKTNHTDIGISLPGTGEAPTLFSLMGENSLFCVGENIAAEFRTLLKGMSRARRFGGNSPTDADAR